MPAANSSKGTSLIVNGTRLGNVKSLMFRQDSPELIDVTTFSKKGREFSPGPMPAPTLSFSLDPDDVDLTQLQPGCTMKVEVPDLSNTTYEFMVSKVEIGSQGTIDVTLAGMKDLGEKSVNASFEEQKDPDWLTSGGVPE